MLKLLNWTRLGNIIWNKNVCTGTAYSVQQTFDSQFIVAGEIRIDWENYDVYVARTVF
ncbi:MAG: hypothetical protein JSW07_00985 [bacterium]|nr:MAG: hypothetical protein JSW07_00985 [bacterium]